MTSSSLTWGCAFIAFGPVLSLLFLLTYQKAQLIIIVTTSAFAFLLSSLLSSLIWLLISTIPGTSDIALLLLLPGVLSQFLLRCGYVTLYHNVEQVIRKSIQKHEEHHLQRQQLRQQSQQQHGQQGATANNSSTSSPATDSLSETAKLRLELNDWSCGIASGIGFGGMHAIMLYGTLLASESGNIGTLYQDSCPNLPSLIVSAINTLFFSLLDIVWMLNTFYGVRQRKQKRHRHYPRARSAAGWGTYLGGNNMTPRQSGNIVLLVTIISHVCATLVTLLNRIDNGCVISLPLLGVVFLITFLLFYGGISKIYNINNNSNMDESSSSASIEINNMNQEESHENNNGGTFHED